MRPNLLRQMAREGKGLIRWRRIELSADAWLLAFPPSRRFGRCAWALCANARGPDGRIIGTVGERIDRQRARTVLQRAGVIR